MQTGPRLGTRRRPEVSRASFSMHDPCTARGGTSLLSSVSGFGTDTGYYEVVGLLLGREQVVSRQLCCTSCGNGGLPTACLGATYRRGLTLKQRSDVKSTSYTLLDRWGILRLSKSRGARLSRFCSRQTDFAEQHLLLWAASGVTSVASAPHCLHCPAAV